MKPTLPPVDVWSLLHDGLEGPLLFGIHRAFKHAGPEMTEAEIARLVEAQHNELMNWFAETFQFDYDEEEPDA